MKLNLHRFDIPIFPFSSSSTTTTSLLPSSPSRPQRQRQQRRRWQELTNTHSQPRLSGCLLLRQTHPPTPTAIDTYMGHQSLLNALLPSQTTSLKTKTRIIKDSNNMNTLSRLNPPVNPESTDAYFSLLPHPLAMSLQAHIHPSPSVPMLHLMSLLLDPRTVITRSSTWLL